MPTSGIDYPGVSTRENILRRSVAPTISAGLGCIIGKTDKGPDDQAVVISSWKEFGFIYGGNGDMAMAAYLYFANGGSQLLVSRAVGTGAKESSVVIATTLTISASYKGTSGDKLAVKLSAAPSASDATLLNLTVLEKNARGDYVDIEKHLGVSLKSTETRYIVNALKLSEHVRAAYTGAGTAITGADLETNKPLTTGADGAAPVLANYTTAFGYTGGVLVPLTLNLPGITDTAIINSITAEAKNRGDIFVVVDPPKDRDKVLAVVQGTPNATNILDWSKDLTSTSYAAVYFPRIRVQDPWADSLGAVVDANPGGAVMGVISNVDTRVGVWRTPAGPLASFSSSVAPVKNLTPAELALLHSASNPINPLRSVPGSGLCIMGGRTIGSSTFSDRYVSIRRTLGYLRRSLSTLVEFALFEPNGPELWLEVRTRISVFLEAFWESNGLRGSRAEEAFYVICDETNNPPSTVASGHLNIEVGVAAEYPAEFIIIQIAQVDGVASVSVL